MDNVPALAPAAAEIFLAVAGMVLLLVGAFVKRGKYEVVTWLSVVALAVALVLVGGTHGPLAAPGFGGMYLTDPFAAFAKVLVLIGTAVVAIMAMPYLQREGAARFEFPVLLLFAALGMMLMASAGNLILLYMALEMQSLALYVCAAFRRSSLRATEAGLKYFVLGSLASGMMLYGLSLIYGFTGTVSYSVLMEVVATPAEVAPGVIIGLVFLLAGLAFKVSAVPFHMWTPDVYQGAPTPVTAFFASAPKVAAIALTVRVLLEPFGALVAEWQQIIVVIAALSMVVGALAALVQTNIKRLLAYSSIGHMGYVLIGLAAGSEAGVRGMLVYLAIYVVMNLGTFAVILAMRRQGRMVEQIDDLSGLARNHPAMAALMAIFMFSMAGIPPLAGFFAKFYVFIAAVEAGMYWLAIVGVISAVVAAFYYIRIVKVMYFDEPEAPFDRPLGRPVAAVMGVSGALTLLFFAWPDPVVAGAELAAAALVGAG